MKTKKKLDNLHIQAVSGGKDPVRMVEDFILMCGESPDECVRTIDNETQRWLLKGSQLEILLENLKSPEDITIYMGLTIAKVPLKNTQDFLVTVLESADALLGVKVSLVGHFLIMSSAFSMNDISLEDLEHNYNLLVQQIGWFQEVLLGEE